MSNRLVDTGSPDPQSEYARRLAAKSEVLRKLERQDRILSGLRLIVGLLFAFLLWIVFIPFWIPVWWLVAPVILFMILAALHERVIRKKAVFSRSVQFYRGGLNRIRDDWMDQGNPGSEFADEHHPYSEDLDLFGKGSLFQLLSLARTQAGESTLADWLRHPSSLSVIFDRQSAVEDLRPRLDFREDLASLGSEVQLSVQTDRMSSWGSAPPRLGGGFLRLLALTLVLITGLTGAGWAFLDWGRQPFFLALLLQAGFGFSCWRRVIQSVREVERPEADLKLLSRLLARVEQEEFRTPMLRELRNRLKAGGTSASSQIAHLSRLVERLDDRRNIFFRPVSYLVLWSTQIAFAVESWRREHGPKIRIWVGVIGELEALSSLAAYAYEHPSDPFPELVEEGPLLHGDKMGHPLLPQSRCVPNSVRLDRDLRLLIVSGSNMSGKSTFLRTIGINTVLALAGAPVRAERLRLSILNLGATLRIQDSLQEGKSRFYAEILRVRQVLELARRASTLFLLDEILQGTNSHDRLIGAESVIRTLISEGAIGLATTHDLALTRIAEALAPHAANVHFQEQMIDGQLDFDYQLHPGVVQRSNALDLMRSIGIPV